MRNPDLDIIGEDEATERIIDALVKREAECLKLFARQRLALCWGGSKVENRIAEWEAFVRRNGYASLTIFALDGNGRGTIEARARLEALLPVLRPPHCILAIPDPHIERWLLLDGHALHRVLAAPPVPAPPGMGRDFYKNRLADLAQACLSTHETDGTEYAPDIAAVMDFAAAEAADPSLRHFLTDLRAALKQLIPPKA
jgi:hypothetical protein